MAAAAAASTLVPSAARLPTCFPQSVAAIPLLEALPRAASRSTSSRWAAGQRLAAARGGWLDCRSWDAKIPLQPLYTCPDVPFMFSLGLMLLYKPESGSKLTSICVPGSFRACMCSPEPPHAIWVPWRSMVFEPIRPAASVPLFSPERR